MRFALIDGQRREAHPGISGVCPACNAAMVAKCGEIRVWHWAHRGRRSCDHWWEAETEWHRAWKNEFPVEWQEVVHFAESGEKHIADVKTDDGWVVECQHSALSSEERRAREAFYQQMVWIVHGTRRKRDLPSFETAVKHACVVRQKPVVGSVHPDKCALLRDWSGSGVAVFLDFETPDLWLLWPGSSGQEAYLSRLVRADLVQHLRDGSFEGVGAVNRVETTPQRRKPPSDFDRFVARYRQQHRARVLRRL